MPKAKKAPDETTPDQPGQVVEIRKKAPTDWGALLKRAEENHWRKLRVTIQVREKLHAGKPKALDAANAMLKARGLEDQIEAIPVDDPNARAEAAAEVVDQGVCEFHRREGKPGLWMPSNNLKAMMKENWSVLGYRVEHRGSRGALAEGVFVFGIDSADRDWILLSAALAPDGIDTSVSHTTGPRGPVSSIKRNEFLLRPAIVFDLWIAVAIAGKLPDEAMADTLLHASEHGVGANRSQGLGKFDVMRIESLTQ